MTEKRRGYDKNFKISAVKMIPEEGITTAEVSRNLGVKENSLYKWKREYLSDQQQAFPRQRKNEAGRRGTQGA